MTDVKPAPPSQLKTKRRSIKTKFLVALLVLSLLPLILFVAITRSVLLDVRDDVKAALIRNAHKEIGLLNRNQATIATAMLAKVEAETQMAAFFARALLRNPSAFGHARSYSANEKPEDIAAAAKYILAPGVSLAAAQPVLDLTSNLDGLFGLMAKDDPNLKKIYVGMQSGVFRQYPWDDDARYRLDFTFDPALAQPPNERGKIPAPLWQAFKQNGVTLSANAVVTTTDPGNQWAVSDDESEQVYSLRREKTGLAVYSAYDPRTRPWYRNAIGRDGAVWTTYPDFGAGLYVFSLGKGLENQIGDKVSPSLAQEFARRQISFAIANTKISMVESNKWELEDGE